METILERLSIPASHCGPVESGQGGYAAGLLARHVPGPATVTLRRPVPLDVELEIVERDGLRLLRRGEETIAEGAPGRVEAEPPAPVAPAEAERASRGSICLAEGYPFPDCFVCGPARREDGLQIFPGPIGREGVVACTWTPAAHLCDEAGRVRVEYRWAALDCPGGISTFPASEKRPLLGRMSARFLDETEGGRQYVVLGWPIAREGRKHRVGSALLDERGELRGLAHAVWIEPRRP